MIVTTEQTATAKLRLVPKPWAEMSDEEAETYLNEVIRSARAKQPTKRGSGGRKAPKSPTNEPNLAADDELPD